MGQIKNLVLAYQEGEYLDQVTRDYVESVIESGCDE